MTVFLLHNQGEMFLSANGIPLNGGQLFYYQAGTLVPASTYSDPAGSILNSNPVVLNSSGRLTTPVYIGSAYNYKELLADSNSVTQPGWPWDNIPAATGAPAALTGFERLFLPWTLITSANSPVTLGLSQAGNGYECNAISGNIVFNLPGAATAGLSGTGYFFKRIDGSGNSVSIVPNGTDNIDGVNAAIGVSAGFSGVYIVSDGAQWLTYSFYSAIARLAGSYQAITSASSTLTVNMANGWHAAITLNASVTTVAVSNWPASGTLGKLTLEITNGGSFTMAGWPGTTIWSGGAAPTLTPSGKDTIVLTSVDGGSNFRGYLTSQAMA